MGKGDTRAEGPGPPCQLLPARPGPGLIQALAVTLSHILGESWDPAEDVVTNDNTSGARPHTPHKAAIILL